MPAQPCPAALPVDRFDVPVEDLHERAGAFTHVVDHLLRIECFAHRRPVLAFQPLESGRSITAVVDGIRRYCAGECIIFCDDRCIRRRQDFFETFNVARDPSAMHPRPATD